MMIEAIILYRTEVRKQKAGNGADGALGTGWNVSVVDGIAGTCLFSLALIGPMGMNGDLRLNRKSA